MSGKFYFLFLFLSFANLNIFCQDIHFSQLSQSQLYANPAFAGINYGPKVILQYRNQYPRIGSNVNSGYNTLLASYDQYLSNQSSGFGVQIAGDKFGENIMSRYDISTQYAYQVKLSRFHALRFGLGLHYNIQQVDYSNLVFYDQIDPLAAYGQYLPTNESLTPATSTSSFNLSTGLVYFRNNYYLGLSAKNLLSKQDYFNNTGQDRFYATLLSSQIGGVLKMGRDGEVSLFPSALFERQYNVQKLVVNLVSQYKLFHFGLGARHSMKEFESIIFLFGCHFNHVRFNYSYDIVTNQLSSYSGGSHELGLKILLGGEDNSLAPNAEKEILYCPDFLKN